MKCIKILARGSYSNSEVESSYIFTEEFYNLLKDNILSRLVVYELDGKHSEVEAEIYFKDISEVSQLDFTEDYFDDMITDMVDEEIEEVKDNYEFFEDEEEGSWDKLLSKLTELERGIIEGKRVNIREEQIKLSDKLFKVPENFKEKVDNLYQSNREELYKILYKSKII